MAFFYDRFMKHEVLEPYTEEVRLQLHLFILTFAVQGFGVETCGSKSLLRCKRYQCGLFGFRIHRRILHSAMHVDQPQS